MPLLERIVQMQKSGLKEADIINQLREEGVSPKEIYDALNQLQIKSEVLEKDQNDYGGYETGDMKPSMIQEPFNEENPQEEYPSEGYPPVPEYPSPYEQGAEGYYTPYQEVQQETNIETINEIAEQIFEEKNAEIKKQISEIKNFKEEAQAEIERLNKRLERIEKNFSELQMAIIRKIGEYGENLRSISEEIHATQDSFSKILNPLTDNIRELQKITGFMPEEPSERDNRENQIKKNSFEEYLR